MNDLLVELICEGCGKLFMGEGPKYCCSGSIQSQCGCMGQIVSGQTHCSEECWKAIEGKQEGGGHG